jgi:hypothetical protein
MSNSVNIVPKPSTTNITRFHIVNVRAELYKKAVISVDLFSNNLFVRNELLEMTEEEYNNWMTDEYIVELTMEKLGFSKAPEPEPEVVPEPTLETVEEVVEPVVEEEKKEVVEKRLYYDYNEEIIEDTLYIHKNYVRGETHNYIVSEMIYDNGISKFNDFIHELAETKDHVSKLL